VSGKKKPGPAPGTGGRAKKPVDFAALDKLLAMQGTAEECAGVLNVSVDTLDARVREKFGITFAEYAAPRRASGRMSLRRAQFVTAVQKQNPTMLIWLGKNVLGQTDKQEITGAGGAPLVPAKALPDYSQLTTEELRTFLALAEKARPKGQSGEEHEPEAGEDAEPSE